MSGGGMTAFASPGHLVPNSSARQSRRVLQCRVRPGLRLRPGRSARTVHRASGVRAVLEALLFDCDGVLADTERDAHRVAFNMAFAEEGVNTEWDEALYGVLLETGGGKERMTAHWNNVGWPTGFSDPDARVSLVRRLHARKTELFMSLVASGKVPLREGVQRLVDEARSSGVTVAVCSTSNEKAVAEIVRMLGEGNTRDIRIFAGDVVPAKKPDPAIYNLAANELELNPAKVCVIEDSFIGLKAAKAAGMNCLVTKSSYTQAENFEAADRVVQSLDSPRIGLQDLKDLVSANGAFA